MLSFPSLKYLPRVTFSNWKSHNPSQVMYFNHHTLKLFSKVSSCVIWWQWAGNLNVPEIQPHKHRLRSEPEMGEQVDLIFLGHSWFIEASLRSIVICLCTNKGIWVIFITCFLGRRLFLFFTVLRIEPRAFYMLASTLPISCTPAQVNTKMQ
jgi:hypothetical protein